MAAPAAQNRSEFIAGLFLVTGLFLLIGTVWVLGRERQIFQRQIAFYADFIDARGLNTGAPVRLGGIPIGRVGGVEFSPDFASQKVRVRMDINTHYQDRLTNRSIISIETQGLLGDRYLSVNFSPSEDNKSEPLTPGSVLPSREPADIMSMVTKLDSVAGNVADASVHLKNILSKVDAEELNGAIKGLGQVMDQVNKGDGTLHRLIYTKPGQPDPFTDLSAIITEIRTGKGLLHELIYSADQGGMGPVLSEFAAVVKNLKVATDAMAQGSGTIGALLFDSKVYDNLVEVTDDAKRSVILRSVVRSALQNDKKGS